MKCSKFVFLAFSLGLVMVFAANDTPVTKVIEINEQEDASKGRYKLLSDNLDEIADAIPDGYKIKVISALGKMRIGKSYLLNKFLDYLDEKLGTGVCHSGESCSRFQSKHQVDRVTTGVWLSRAYLDSDKRTAILVMDVQGLFDLDSTPTDAAALFIITAGVSSTMLFNIRGEIGGDDFEKLNEFATYSSKAMENIQEGVTMFQQLTFLVKNWGHDDFDFGYSDKYLRKTLHNGNKATERVRNGIISSFNTTNCFLLPSPGEQIMHGNLKKEANGDFTNLSNELFKSLIDDDVVMKAGGKAIDSKIKFKQVFSTFVKHTSSKNLKVLDVNTLVELIELRDSLETYIKQYDDHMLSVLNNGYVKPKLLEEKHRNKSNSIIDPLRKKFTPIADDDDMRVIVKLENSLKSRYNDIKRKNDKLYGFRDRIDDLYNYFISYFTHPPNPTILVYQEKYRNF